MKTFAIPVGLQDEKRVAQEIRDFAREWVGLLADGECAEALALLSPEIPPQSGSVDASKEPQWRPALLEAVIANYGTPVRDEGDHRTYSVVPLNNSLRDEFESRVVVSFDRGTRSEESWLGGGVEFDLPLNYPWGNALGDLTARLLFKRVGQAEMALVLFDIHVL